MCFQSAPQAAPALALPSHLAPWPCSRPLCLLEMYLHSMVPQSRQPLCPKAAIWNSSFVSFSPSYCAFSEVIWPSWTMLFPWLRCPWASQYWLPLCPPASHRSRCSAFAFHVVAKGCLVSSVTPAAGLPGSACLFPLLYVFTLKPQPKSLLPSLPCPSVYTAVL